jgi:hypothetical protein
MEVEAHRERMNNNLLELDKQQLKENTDRIEKEFEKQKAKSGLVDMSQVFKEAGQTPELFANATSLQIEKINASRQRAGRDLLFGGNKADIDTQIQKASTSGMAFEDMSKKLREAERMMMEDEKRLSDSSYAAQQLNLEAMETQVQNRIKVGLDKYERDLSHETKTLIERFSQLGTAIPDAIGVRAADSIVRNAAMKKHGPVSLSSRQYYPIWDWNKETLVSNIKKSGIKLPEDYHLFGRTFDGLDIRFIVPLMKYKPEDYKKVLEWFPLVDMQVWLLKKRGII